MPARLGFVGLGRMGAPMAANLVRHGFDVTVHDLDETRMAGLAALGARPAARLAEVAAADAVFVSVPGPPEFEQVVLGPSGLLERMREGSCLVGLSTISPALIREVEAAARPRGIDVLDAPVTGGAHGARDGTLTIIVGADAAALERRRGLLDPLAAEIVHTGPVGTGSVAKLVTNMLWFVHVTALADALALGVKAGIGPQVFGDLIPKSAAGSWAAEHNLPDILRGEDEPSFTLALCRKDLSLVAELAGELDVPVPLAEIAGARFRDAYERFGPRAGQLAVARLSEEAGGVSIRAAQ